MLQASLAKGLIIPSRTLLLPSPALKPLRIPQISKMLFINFLAAALCEDSLKALAE